MAQSTAGTNLSTNWNDRDAQVAAHVYADWNDDGDYGDTYEDITAYVVDLHIEHSVYDPVSGLATLGGAQPSFAQVTLRNETNWFSRDNSSGLAGTYTALANGIYDIPLKIELGYVDDTNGDEELVQFTGYIEGFQEWEDANQKLASAQCQDVTFDIRQEKQSTALYTDYSTDALIEEYLGLASLTNFDLDKGLHVIPYGWIDDGNIRDEIVQVAASEGGLFYADKAGDFQFRRVSTLLEASDSTAAQGTLDVGETWRLDDATTWRNLYSGVRTEYAGRYEGPEATIYTSPTVLEIPPGEAVVETCRFLHPVTGYITPVHSEDYYPTAGGEIVDEGASGVQVSVSASAHRADVTFTNNLSSQMLYIVDLQIRGYPLYGNEAQEIEETTSISPALVADKVLPIQGNPYLQTREQAERVAGYMLARLERPRRMLRWRGPLMPWLEMLDMVHVDHNTMTYNPAINQDCWVVGMAIDYNANGMLEMELTLLPDDNLYAYDSPFIIGSSTYADSGNDELMH